MPETLQFRLPKLLVPLCIALTVSTLISNQSAFAYNYDDLICLVTAEQKALGKSDGTGSLDQRLQAVELAVLGKVGSGTEKKRLGVICARLGISTGATPTGTSDSTVGQSRTEGTSTVDAPPLTKPLTAASASSFAGRMKKVPPEKSQSALDPDHATGKDCDHFKNRIIVQTANLGVGSLEPQKRNVRRNQNTSSALSTATDDPASTRTNGGDHQVSTTTAQNASAQIVAKAVVPRGASSNVTATAASEPVNSHTTVATDEERPTDTEPVSEATTPTATTPTEQSTANPTTADAATSQPETNVDISNVDSDSVTITTTEATATAVADEPSAPDHASTEASPMAPGRGSTPSSNQGFIAVCVIATAILLVSLSGLSWLCSLKQRNRDSREVALGRSRRKARQLEHDISEEHGISSEEPEQQWSENAATVPVEGTIEATIEGLDSDEDWNFKQIDSPPLETITFDVSRYAPPLPAVTSTLTTSELEPYSSQSIQPNWTSQTELSSQSHRVTGPDSSQSIEPKWTSHTELSSQSHRATGPDSSQSIQPNWTSQTELSSQSHSVTGPETSQSNPPKWTSETELSSQSHRVTGPDSFQSNPPKWTSETELSSQSHRVTEHDSFQSNPPKWTSETELSSQSHRVTGPDSFQSNPPIPEKDLSKPVDESPVNNKRSDVLASALRKLHINAASVSSDQPVAHQTDLSEQTNQSMADSTRSTMIVTPQPNQERADYRELLHQLESVAVQKAPIDSEIARVPAAAPHSADSTNLPESTNAHQQGLSWANTDAGHSVRRYLTDKLDEILSPYSESTRWLTRRGYLKSFRNGESVLQYHFRTDTSSLRLDAIVTAADGSKRIVVLGENGNGSQRISAPNGEELVCLLSNGQVIEYANKSR